MQPAHGEFRPVQENCRIHVSSLPRRTLRPVPFRSCRRHFHQFAKALQGGGVPRGRPLASGPESRVLAGHLLHSRACAATPRASGISRMPRAVLPERNRDNMTSIESLNPDIPLFARTGINLASAGLGARAIWASNQFFAPLDRMLQGSRPRLHRGQVRRPRQVDGRLGDGSAAATVAIDSAIIRLAGAGRIIGFDIDTTHFTGNYAPAARIEACSFAGRRNRPPTRHGSRSCATSRSAPRRITTIPARTSRAGRICASVSIPTAASLGSGSTACRNSTRPMRRARSTSPRR